MNHLNSLILEGTISDDFQTLEAPAGIEGITFPISVERSYTDNAKEQHKEVSVFEIRAYGSMAEYAKQKCQVGKGIRVVGRLKQVRYEVAGKEYSKVVAVAEHIEYKSK